MGKPDDSESQTKAGPRHIRFLVSQGSGKLEYSLHAYVYGLRTHAPVGILDFCGTPLAIIAHM